MKGFKPTGYGPSSGFTFPSSMGFTGSSGAYTNVQPYVRRKAFAAGGFVRQDNPRMKVDSVGDQGSALVRRAKSYCQVDQESGGKTALRPGYKRGGKARVRKADGGKAEMIRKAIMATRGAGAGALSDAELPAIVGTRGSGALSDVERRMQDTGGPLTQLRRQMTRQKTQPLERNVKRPSVGIAPKGRFYADGGKTEYPKPKYSTAFWDRVKSAFGVGDDSTGLAKKAEERLSGRRKQVDDYVDEAVTGRKKYARGGAATAAKKAVMTHVSLPAPRGHKGLKAMCKADGGKADFPTKQWLEREKAHYDMEPPYDTDIKTHAQMKRVVQRHVDHAIRAPNHVPNLAKTRDIRPYWPEEQPGGEDFIKTVRGAGHGPVKSPRTGSSKGHGRIKPIPRKLTRD